MIDNSNTLATADSALVRAARGGTNSLTFENTDATAIINVFLGGAASLTTGIKIGPGKGYEWTRLEHGAAIDGELYAITDTAGATYQIVET